MSNLTSVYLRKKSAMYKIAILITNKIRFDGNDVNSIKNNIGDVLGHEYANIYNVQSAESLKSLAEVIHSESHKLAKLRTNELKSLSKDVLTQRLEDLVTFVESLVKDEFDWSSQKVVLAKGLGAEVDDVEGYEDMTNDVMFYDFVRGEAMGVEYILRQLESEGRLVESLSDKDLSDLLPKKDTSLPEA